nr:hypothetical protein CFP56_46930 [Quercus suber]
MGETGLFNIAQAMIMMKGMMGWCLNHETTIGRVHIFVSLCPFSLKYNKYPLAYSSPSLSLLDYTTD